MKRRLLLLAAIAGLPLAHAQTPAQAPTQTQAPGPVIELHGVKYTATAQVAGSTLQLNGAGTRYKFVIKVYTAGLYLTGKAATPEAVLAAPGPKRMHVVMLRDIDANELGRLFTRGMQDNMPREEFSKLIPGTLALADIFASRKKLLAGDIFFVDYVPGTGTQVVVNGKTQGDPIREPEFYSALLRIWLGASPADNQLKDALLGREAQSSRASSRQK